MGQMNKKCSLDASHSKFKRESTNRNSQISNKKCSPAANDIKHLVDAIPCKAKREPKLPPIFCHEDYRKSESITKKEDDHCFFLSLFVGTALTGITLYFINHYSFI